MKSIGECPIDGEDIFARVMNYETKTPDEAAFEAHQKYADIQFTLIGAEGIAVVDTDSVEVRQAYNPDTDLAFFNAQAQVSGLVNARFVCLPHSAGLPYPANSSR
ncbi:MAG: hypothetical protein CMI18_04230 [Opitutaceae bacterium]|nr:hypothetical protein [Opitutaceae bacterium]